MYLSPETFALMQKLAALDAATVADLFASLHRDHLTVAPPSDINGINEERERLRNENTKAERKRAADRERMAAKREAVRVAKEVARLNATVPYESQEVAATVAGYQGDAVEAVAATSSDASRAHVVNTTSSLRSEDTSEAKASSVGASKPADPEKPKTKPPKSERGTRLPPDWEPSAEEFDLARSEGLTDEEIRRGVVEFRNYWCARGRDGAKLSWRLTWHNNAIRLAGRKRERGERLAAAAASTGGRRRGASTFADIYAERHGFTAVREPVPD